jgi:mannose-1-phosphate guanylyltransferase/mannose-6-phosphate isomerase
MDGIFAGLSPESFDYLLLEKSRRLLVIPAALDWSDLGAWDEVYRQAHKDHDGNAIRGNVMALATRNSFIHGNHRLIATLGVENLIVVDTPDALLICDMGKAQEVRKLVGLLKEAGEPQAETSSTETRPWGSFTVLGEGEGYKLKMIEVLPGQKLSLQMHHRRAEHWVVIEGRGEMTLGEEIFSRGPNETFHIPRGEKHTVANPGTETLRFIEVQFGDYLGEDDIVRFEDRYGRV